MPFPPTTLSIDFGTKRIGLAISRGILAEPLGVVENSSGTMGELKDLIASESVQQIVVGLSENTMAEQTRKFVQLLQAEVTVPIEFVDETLSSVTVTEKLRAGGKTHLRRGTIDQYAAAEFLQEYLDAFAK